MLKSDTNRKTNDEAALAGLAVDIAASCRDQDAR
jgi:hypothetical protein